MFRSLGSGANGTLASVGSSLAFGGIYFITPLLAPASAESLWALRNLITIPIIALALLAVRQWHLVVEIAARIRRTPLLVPGIVACGLLMAAQLWVFGWAPLHGRGLHVALGYFLLPLVLVVVGRFLYRDRLVWWQWIAAGIAAIGVGFELIRAGGVSWETLLVALGYPCYFVLRRALGIGHLGGMFWEFLLLAPVALTIVVFTLAEGSVMTANPQLWWTAPVFAVCSGVAIILYVVASRLLTISVFGLLSYLEPALLMIAAMLNGERIGAEERFMYATIWGAVLVLVTGGVAQTLRRPRTKNSAAPSSDSSEPRASGAPSASGASTLP